MADIQVAFNVDVPESGLDGLAQVSVHVHAVGWGGWGMSAIDTLERTGWTGPG